jgi:ABC-type nitrate/sulfonate/bicarbonate transport system permease component
MYSNPSGQIAPATPSEPIVLSSKNYMVGFGVGAVIGAALGALVMHFSMKAPAATTPPT